MEKPEKGGGWIAVTMLILLIVMIALNVHC
jgi:hypothetical protein